MPIPSFRHVGRSELPQEFHDAAQRPVPDAVRQLLGLPEGTEVQAHVAIELPDYPICRQWVAWYSAQPVTDDTVAVTVSSQEQWADRQGDLKGMLVKLFTEGKPTIIPVICHRKK